MFESNILRNLYDGNIRVIQCIVRNSTTNRLHNCRNCDDDDALGVLVLLVLLDITVEYADVDDDNGAIPVVIIRDEYGDICGDDCNDVDDDDDDGGGTE